MLAFQAPPVGHGAGDPERKYGGNDEGSPQAPAAGRTSGGFLQVGRIAMALAITLNRIYHWVPSAIKTLPKLIGMWVAMKNDDERKVMFTRTTRDLRGVEPRVHAWPNQTPIGVRSASRSRSSPGRRKHTRATPRSIGTGHVGLISLIPIASNTSPEADRGQSHRDASHPSRARLQRVITAPDPNREQAAGRRSKRASEVIGHQAST